jgi:hypothetical protein
MGEIILSVLNKYEECCFIVVIPDWLPKKGGQYENIRYEIYDMLHGSSYKQIEVISDKFKYYNFFKSSDQDIGRTGTIIFVMSNFVTPLIDSDFLPVSESKIKIPATTLF